MTAWATEPCAWPEDPQQLELDLAAAEQAFLDLHGPQPDDEPSVPADYGRSAARRHIPDRPVTDVLEQL